MLPAWDTERSNGLIVVSEGSSASSALMLVKELLIAVNVKFSFAAGIEAD